VDPEIIPKIFQNSCGRKEKSQQTLSEDTLAIFSRWITARRTLLKADMAAILPLRYMPQ